MNKTEVFSIIISFTLMLISAGCNENVSADLRRYIPSDAVMIGYLDCERLLDHPAVNIQESALSKRIGGNIHVLLRDVGLDDNNQHFDKCYFFTYDSNSHIALILEGKMTAYILANLPENFKAQKIAGKNSWTSDGKVNTTIIELDDNTILVGKNMSEPCLAASASGIGNNQLAANIEKAEYISCIRARNNIPFTMTNVDFFEAALLDTPEAVAVSVKIKPRTPQQESFLLNMISNWPLTASARISCNETIELHDPAATGVIASVSNAIKEKFSNLITE